MYFISLYWAYYAIIYWLETQPILGHKPAFKGSSFSTDKPFHCGVAWHKSAGCITDFLAGIKGGQLKTRADVLVGWFLLMNLRIFQHPCFFMFNFVGKYNFSFNGTEPYSKKCWLCTLYHTTMKFYSTLKTVASRKYIYLQILLVNLGAGRVV